MSFKWSALGLLLLAGCSSSATVNRADSTPHGVEGPRFLESTSHDKMNHFHHPSNASSVIGSVGAASGAGNTAHRVSQSAIHSAAPRPR
jgi:hypothetical protein